MAKVTLKINGQEVSVEKGATILEAAKQAGIYIPTLCYHPFLPLEEACRICVVEDIRGDWSSLVAACVFPVRSGMVIETDSRKVVEARRTIMELLLSDHPNDCMTCYATGNCELQDLAHLYGVKSIKYEGSRHQYEVDSDPNPYLHIDMNKCVLCRRCIRACHDIQGADIWTKVGRGFDQRISTAFGLPLTEAGCELCGHCADFCPVDAIGYRQGRGAVRSWQLNRASTICLLCCSGCRAQYESHRGKVVRVSGDFSSRSNQGALCKRGRFQFDSFNGPDRLLEATVRNADGEPVPCGLDEAVSQAASALQAFLSTNDGSAVAVLCGGMLTNEEYYMAQKLARGALGSNHVDHCAGPWQQAVYEGLENTLGLGAMTNSLDDIALAGSVLVMGSNILENQAIAALRARKAARAGAPLIVAHPEAVPLTKTASLHLPVQPGMEALLLAGLARVILDEGLQDKEFIKQYTQDFSKFERSIQKVKLSEVAERTGVTEDALCSAARLLASRRPCCLIYGIDPRTSPSEEGFYRLAAGFQLLLGSVGMPGGGVNILGAAGNAQGASDFGVLPRYLPGYRPVTAAASRKAAAKAWGVEIPGKAGMNWPEVFEAVEKGQVKALYLVGLNPFDLGLTARKMESLLARLDLLIVQDCLKTRAADFAHVVLPALSFLEKAGTATNCERRLQRLQPVVEGIGSGRADFDLFNALLAHLAPPLQCASPEQAFSEAGAFFVGLNGLTMDRIPVEGIQWPVDSEAGGTVFLPLPESDRQRFRFFSVKI